MTTNVAGTQALAMLEDGVTWSIYERLWNEAVAKPGPGIVVRYVGRLANDDVGGFAPFDEPPRTEKRPQIIILRPYYADPSNKPSRDLRPDAPAGAQPPNACVDLVLLAHEYGHFFSYKAGNWTKEFRQALKASKCVGTEVSESVRKLVREEEARAWANARKVLVGFDFNAWDAFDSAKATSEARYELGFGGEAPSQGSENRS